MYSSQTLGSKAKTFNWHYDSEVGLYIYRVFSNTDKVCTLFSIQELRKMYEYFKDHDVLYLGNNVVKLKNGTEIDGLGRFAYDVLGKSATDAQAVSQLAAVFVDVGIFKVDASKRQMKLYSLKADWVDKLI